GLVNTATTRVSAASTSVTTAGVNITAQEEFARPTRILSTARPTRILPTIDLKDKGKGIMQKPKKPPKNLRKAQIQMDEELAMRLHEEEKAAIERMQRDRVAQEEASNAALTVKFDDVQARIDADALLAAILQEEGKEQFSIDEQARFLVETIAERKRFFAAQRAEQIRNKPSTKTQLRNNMTTFLKTIGRFTYNQLKNKSLEEIQKLYEKEQKWINDFIHTDSEMVKDSGKRMMTKLEDDAEKEELRTCLDIVLGDDIAINVESLATKYPIVDWKTHILTQNMIQDVVDLYRLVKERTMFEKGDFDDDFDDIDDMVNEAMENVEGDTMNIGGAFNTATTGVSIASALVTTVGVSISIAEPRTP
ncbi:hypothetical protein Tco_1101215, partial [Tanacetum coccineum]